MFEVGDFFLIYEFVWGLVCNVVYYLLRGMYVVCSFGFRVEFLILVFLIDLWMLLKILYMGIGLENGGYMILGVDFGWRKLVIKSREGCVWEMNEVRLGLRSLVFCWIVVYFWW